MTELQPLTRDESNLLKLLQRLPDKPAGGSLALRVVAGTLMAASLGIGLGLVLAEPRSSTAWTTMAFILFMLAFAAFAYAHGRLLRTVRGLLKRTGALDAAATGNL
jgi:hypothetical protein